MLNDVQIYLAVTTPKHMMCRKFSTDIHCCKRFNYFIPIVKQGGKKSHSPFKDKNLSLDTIGLISNKHKSQLLKNTPSLIAAFFSSIIAPQWCFTCIKQNITMPLSMSSDAATSFLGTGAQLAQGLLYHQQLCRNHLVISNSTSKERKKGGKLVMHVHKGSEGLSTEQLTAITTKPKWQP